MCVLCVVGCVMEIMIAGIQLMRIAFFVIQFHVVLGNLGDLIFNLSFLEYLVGDIHDSIEMLKNQYVIQSYKDKLAVIIGNSLMSLNKPKEARELFVQEIKSLLSKEPNLIVILTIYQLIGKVLECYRMEKNKVGPAQFFKEIENRLFKLNELYKHIDKSTSRSYEGIMDLILMKFLHFGNNNTNYGLMNFVLERAQKGNIMSNPEKINTKYRIPFCHFLMSVCDYLRAKPNFGGFEKNYSNYLELGTEILANCPVNVETLKLNCNLQFNKGIFALQKGERDKAKIIFKTCFELIHGLFKFEETGVFDFLNKLAKYFIKQNDFENALFFYQEIQKLNLTDQKSIDLLNLKIDH